MSSSEEIRLDPEFEPSFNGGRREHEWIIESLGGFYEDQLLVDVIHRVKGGKEATVYCCRSRAPGAPPLLAAKVFRPRRFRAMRNDSFYKQGRGLVDGEGKLVLDGRSRRALAKRTRYGRRLDSTGWCRHEYTILQELSEAGVSVPRPIAASENAILMEYVGDEAAPAPVLAGLSLEPAEAEVLFQELLRQVGRMLSRFVVHADLSAYNVLYRHGEARLIDFPQAVDALRHPAAYSLLERDLDRLCAWFAKQGVAADAPALARRLWSEELG